MQPSGIIAEQQNIVHFVLKLIVTKHRLRFLWKRRIVRKSGAQTQFLFFFFFYCFHPIVNALPYILEVILNAGRFNLTQLFFLTLSYSFA